MIDIGDNTGRTGQVCSDEPDSMVRRSRFEGHSAIIAGVESHASEADLLPDGALFFEHKL
jgi:hypothetical protein